MSSRPPVTVGQTKEGEDEELLAIEQGRSHTSSPRSRQNSRLEKFMMEMAQSQEEITHSFIHSGHFYSAPSSPLLLRSAPDYSTDTVSEFHAKAHRQLQVKDLPKVPTWRLEWESNPRPSG